MRIGHGYDTHRFAAGRPLILGGVAVPHDQGLLAHSDGDVVIHALCDALLGPPPAMEFPGRSPLAMSQNDDFCAEAALFC